MQDPGSAFRGTTEQIFNNGHQRAGAWADVGGWVYEIEGQPSWNVNQLLEGRVPKPGGGFESNMMRAENEQAILATVPPS